ncbi:MAG TPA: glucokinase [Polyangiaceae bacterium]|nr:glucokinase [Polyangiaceae bacterium]
MILAGDIGGTKTNIALFQTNAGQSRPQLLAEQTFHSGNFAGLEQIVALFLESRKQAPTLEGACFGVAGPIVDRSSRIPNLPWVIDADSLQRAFSLPQVTLINDLEATAEGIAALNPDELETLNAGVPSTGTLQCGAVIAAGTGLGMAVLQPIGGQWIPAASEGGHADYAPRNEKEMALLAFLLGRHQRVSTERVVSGPGLHAIYDFVVALGKLTPNPDLARAIAANKEEAPAQIGQAALAKQCPACVEALDLFAAAYGACAGNLGLTALSSGGLFLGGGIATKILPKLRDGTFMTAFKAKGRLSPLVERMPVHVILNPQAPLFGAARRALRDRAATLR